MRLITATIAAAMCTACVSTTTTVVKKDYDVRLEAKPNQGYVKINSKAQGYHKSGKKDGYVGYRKGESGVTTFYVKNKKVDGKDPADCAESAEWVITRLQLTTKGSTIDQKGQRSSWGTKQPAWLKESFPDVDFANGDLFPQQTPAKGVTRLDVTVDNGQEGTEWIYYMVTLSSCDGKNQVRTDPVWKNGGRN